MSQLTTILGGMVIDEEFRNKLVNARAATLVEYKINLTADERQSLENMMESFGTGIFNPCIQLFASECPNWPCLAFQMSIPPGPVVGITEGAKKTVRKPPRPGRKKTAKKATGKKTAGKGKKSSRR